MDYDEFLKCYREIIRQSVELLKNNRFAIFTVGDVRDKKGFYRDFIGDTIRAFVDAGANLYNHVILKNAVGTAALRARQIFKNRKLVKIHQNVLIFYKGDPDVINSEFDPIKFEDLEKFVEDED